MKDGDVAVFRTEIGWFAQGLTLDIAAQGSTREDALRRYHLTCRMEDEIRSKGDYAPCPHTPPEVVQSALERQARSGASGKTEASAKDGAQ